MDEDQQIVEIVTPENTASEQARLEALAASMNKHKETDYFARCLERQDQGELSVFVICVDGADAGYCLYNRQPKYALFKKLNIPEIQDLNVCPAFRRQGLGRALITHCEALAKEEGYAHMGIGVGLDSSFGAAQVLYIKAGYVPDGTGVSYDRQQITPGELRPLDECLCLMMIKDLI